LKEIEAIKHQIVLESKGFPRLQGVGCTFKTDKLPDVKKVLEAAKDLETEEEPKMSMGAISSEGVMSVDFSQTMIAPDKIDQSVYQDVFDFKTEDENGEPMSAKFMTADERRLSTSQDKMSLEVVKHDGGQIQMQMVFADPDSVSGSDERLEMDVLSVGVFKSASTLKSLSPLSFADGESMAPK
jgi:hypothetical protein